MKIMGLKHVKKKNVKTNPLMNSINFPLKKIGEFQDPKMEAYFFRAM